MKISIDILFISLTSALYGSLVAAFIILYFNVGERIQIWSERYTPPKNWIRRVLHLTSLIIYLLVFFYTFLFWISLEIDFIKKITLSPVNQLLIFIFNTILFITPFAFLRKRLFREFNVKKLWE